MKKGIADILAVVLALALSVAAAYFERETGLTISIDEAVGIENNVSNDATR
jgi:hypothetical protein